MIQQNITYMSCWNVIDGPFCVAVSVVSWRILECIWLLHCAIDRFMMLFNHCIDAAACHSMTGLIQRKNRVKMTKNDK